MSERVGTRMAEAARKSGGENSGPRWPRRAFLSVWAVIAVVVLTALLYSPAVPQGGIAPSAPSYVDATIPVGTNFTFLFTEAIPVYAENTSSSTSPAVVSVLVSGNWSATNPTWVRVNLGGPGSPTCNGLFGCDGGPANLSGSIQLATEVTEGGGPGAPSLVLYLEFWSRGGDTVTTTSPIAASVVS